MATTADCASRRRWRRRKSPIVPIVGGGDSAAIEAAHKLAAELRTQGFRLKVDDSDKRPGFKFARWEMCGVPLRLELGARDLAQGVATLVRRDKEKGDDGAKFTVALGEVAQSIGSTLVDIQANLLLQARTFLSEHTRVTEDQAEFFELCKARAGMIDITWCGRAECEAIVKAQTSASTRIVRPLAQRGARCVACGEPATVRAYFAQSY